MVGAQSRSPATTCSTPFSAMGIQHVWVVPSLDLVILRAAREWPPNAWDVSRIPNLLIRALRDPDGFNQ